MASIYVRLGRGGVKSYQVKYKGSPDGSGNRKSKTFKKKKDAERFKVEVESAWY